MVYKHAYLNILLLLHSPFMLCVVKMRLKGEVRGHALNSHGNYIVDCEKSRERSGSVVECLTRDRRAAGSSLTGVTALWSLSKTHLS